MPQRYTILLATGAMALVLATPVIGHAGPADYDFYDITNGALRPVDAYASLSARVGYRTQSDVILALAGQNLLTERQKQTRGLEAERRVLFSVSKAW